MPLPLRRRISCSLKAVSIAWLISGTVFVVVIRGPGTITAWLIWGTPFFLAGWILVGLPFVALGDRILRMNRLLLMLVAGTGGALVMELPVVLTMLVDTRPGYRWVWSLETFRWPGMAFAIAATAGWLYRKFLNEESTRFQTPSTAQ
jgi:hypothetical protein